MDRWTIGIRFIIALYKPCENFKVTDSVLGESKWMLTFVNDLKPLESFLWNLGSEGFGIERILKRIIDTYSDNNNPTYTPLLQAMGRQLDLVEESLKPVILGLSDLKLLKSRNRSKRAVIPVVGKALHFLFETLTTADSKVVTSNLKILMTNQEQSMHIIREGLSILNITRAEVRENRKAILKLDQIRHLFCYIQ